MKIAIINTSFFKKRIEDFTSSFKNEHKFETVIYKSVEEIPNILLEIEDDYEAFLINGDFAKNIINKTIEKFEKPVVFFNVEIVQYYHLILYQNIVNKVNFDRMYVDFTPKKFQGNIENYMLDFNLEKSEYSYFKFLEDLNIDELIAYRYNVADEVKKLWNEKKIDVVITRFSTIVEELEKLNIPVSFVYPSREYIENLIKKIIYKADLYYIYKDFPAHILITLRQDKTVTEDIRELNQVNLKRELLEFRREKSITFKVEDFSDGVGVITTEDIVSKITEKYTQCQLKSYLEEKLDVEVNIGYGVGPNFKDALMKSHSSNQESKFSISNSSYLINANDELIGPLDSKNNISISILPSREFSIRAKEIGISPKTLQRVLAVMKSLNSNEISSKELAEKMSVTTRFANKILSTLKKAGEAEEYALDQSSSGRPAIIYKIHLKEDI